MVILIIVTLGMIPAGDALKNKCTAKVVNLLAIITSRLIVLLIMKTAVRVFASTFYYWFKFMPY